MRRATAKIPFEELEERRENWPFGSEGVARNVLARLGCANFQPNGFVWGRAPLSIREGAPTAGLRLYNRVFYSLECKQRW